MIKLTMINIIILITSFIIMNINTTLSKKKHNRTLNINCCQINKNITCTDIMNKTKTIHHKTQLLHK